MPTSGDETESPKKVIGSDLATEEDRVWVRLTREAPRYTNDWWPTLNDRKGASSNAVLSRHRTYNLSAKMSADEGVIQGYCDVAAIPPVLRDKASEEWELSRCA